MAQGLLITSPYSSEYHFCYCLDPADLGMIQQGAVRCVGPPLNKPQTGSMPTRVMCEWPPLAGKGLPSPASLSRFISISKQPPGSSRSPRGPLGAHGAPAWGHAVGLHNSPARRGYLAAQHASSPVVRPSSAHCRRPRSRCSAPILCWAASRARATASSQQAIASRRRSIAPASLACFRWAAFRARAAASRRWISALRRRSISSFSLTCFRSRKPPLRHSLPRHRYDVPPFPLRRCPPARFLLSASLGGPDPLQRPNRRLETSNLEGPRSPVPVTIFAYPLRQERDPHLEASSHAGDGRPQLASLLSSEDPNLQEKNLHRCLKALNREVAVVSPARPPSPSWPAI